MRVLHRVETVLCSKRRELGERVGQAVVLLAVHGPGLNDAHLGQDIPPVANLRAKKDFSAERITLGVRPALQEVFIIAIVLCESKIKEEFS